MKKKLTKLVGLKVEEFESFIDSGDIQLRKAQLIPVYKTGDEMALTSIFLSTIRLVKEFRENVVRDIRFSKGKNMRFYTEVAFPELDGSSRVDGLMLLIKSGEIKDAAFFEMKSKNNGIDIDQIQRYMSLAKQLKVGTLVTVSNEFVADPSHSPIDIRVPKSISMYHLSWTYLMTVGHLLVHKNNDAIEDEDQIEIMKEALAYFENPQSGICGYHQMRPGWKEVTEAIRARTSLKVSDPLVKDAVLSWQEELKDMALLLSRRLGVLVRTSSVNKNSFKEDVGRLVKQNHLLGDLTVKDAVSDIRIVTDFELRNVTMSVKILPPLNKGSIGQLGWIVRQVQNCEKKNPELFDTLKGNLWIEANVKFARQNEKVKLDRVEELQELLKGKDLLNFHLAYSVDFGAKFSSPRKFIEVIEKMILDFYQGSVQHLSNWKKPSPKLITSDMMEG